MTSETLNQYISPTPQVKTNFKINVFLKKRLRSTVYFINYFKVKNGVFGNFKKKSLGTGSFGGAFPHQELPPPIVGAPSSS
jgi:hypothetical protein